MSENRRIIDGVVHVWSIHDNAWVTLEYWNWVNGKGKRESPRPGVRVTPA